MSLKAELALECLLRYCVAELADVISSIQLADQQDRYNQGKVDALRTLQIVIIRLRDDPLTPPPALD